MGDSGGRDNIDFNFIIINSLLRVARRRLGLKRLLHHLLWDHLLHWKAHLGGVRALRLNRLILIVGAFLLSNQPRHVTLGVVGDVPLGQAVEVLVHHFLLKLRKLALIPIVQVGEKSLRHDGSPNVDTPALRVPPKLHDVIE